jgi:hypothetical protein
MGSVDGLQIYLGIPIAVKQNNYVSLMKIDSQTTSSCGQDKDLFVRLWVLKVFNATFSVVSRGLTVNSTVSVPTESQHVI